LILPLRKFNLRSGAIRAFLRRMSYHAAGRVTKQGVHELTVVC
jgi:hypothetical protein